ncbi:MAG: hypothetical protein LLG02_11505 [Pelosinus sp.]|nr:hypothetical protein [Pelosinus sp.]
MSSQKFDLFTECLGPVTILTDENVVFQGVVRRHGDDSRKSGPQVVVTVDEFVFVELVCEPAVINDGQLVTIFPVLFNEDDIVKINIGKIVAVGPSNGCLDGSGTGGTGSNSKNSKNSNSKNSKG